MIALPL